MKTALVGITFVLIALSLFKPVIFGYGLDIYTAETKLPGIYSETLQSAHNEAYYRVNCTAGQLLTASINFSVAFDLNLYILDIAPPYDTVDSSEGNGTIEVVEFQTIKSGFYYIRVTRSPDSPGNVNFTLTITLEQKFQIPAFELPFIAFGILVFIGLLILKKNPKFW